jgi:hypothetical protein
MQRVFDNAVAEIFQVLRLTMLVTLDEGRKDGDKRVDDGGDGLKEKLQFNEMLDDDDDDGDDDDDDDDDDDNDNDQKESDDGEDGHPYSIISRRHIIDPLHVGSSDEHTLHTELVQPKYLQPPQLGHIIASMLDAWRKDKKKKKKIEMEEEEEEMVMTMTGFHAALVEVGE